ncbi:MAG: DUF1553 domain-containing protein [Pirellulales bacterium]
MRTLATRLALVTTFCLAVSAAANAAEVDPDGVAFFEKNIRPLLVARCQECHGEEIQEAGLRLDNRTAAFAGTDGMPVFEPGQPDESRLIQAIRYTGQIQMPPDDKLSDEEIARITEWVVRGAPWPEDASPDDADGEAKQTPTSPEAIARARAEHWAFQPVRMPEIPATDASDWIGNPVDAFVLARLEAAGMTPSPRADKRTLLRRATFGLLGLPPTVEQWSQFEADDSPDAYARLIDRLLDSPAYGQRWARHWLDVARYADTKGYVFTEDPNYPYAYTYRDYVVRALNDDLPYDQFIIEQLAADKLPELRERTALAAMGFLTVGRRFNKNMQDIIDDRIDVTTRGLMGLTVACARCHDHKFDPIPTADYYSLYGVFDASLEPDELPLIVEPDENESYQEFQAELKRREEAAESYQREQREQLLAGARAAVDRYLMALLRGSEASDSGEDDAKATNPIVLERWQEFLAKTAGKDSAVFAAWHALAEVPAEEFSARGAEVLAELAGAAEQPAEGEERHINTLVREALTERQPKTIDEVAACYGELFRQFDKTWAELREQHKDKAAEQLTPDQRQLHAVLYGEESPVELNDRAVRRAFSIPVKQKIERLQREAEAWKKESPNAPPRAMVMNDSDRPGRAHIFVRGNSRRRGAEVPRQFPIALTGDQRQVFEDGSGRLEMARLIASRDNPLTARVLVNRVWMQHFGEALVRTPSNFGLKGDRPTHPELLDYLAARFMDEGWSLKKLHRWIMLSATYAQSSDIRPECQATDPENRLLWRMNRQRIEFEAMRDSLLAIAGRLDASIGGQPFDLGAQPFVPRRTIYGQIDRQHLRSELRIFDVASPDSSSPQRPETTVPQQALFLMNSPFVVEQARHLAERVDTSDTAEAIRNLYQIVLTREPRGDEASLAVAFIESAEAEGSDPHEVDASADSDDSSADEGDRRRRRGRRQPDRLDRWQQLAQVILLTNEAMFVD